MLKKEKNNSTEWSQKLKVAIPYELSISLLSICPKERKSVCPGGIYTAMFTTALLTTAKIK